MAIRVFVFAASLAAIALVPTLASAQSTPKELNVAPNAPRSASEPAPQAQGEGRPANICRELVAFLQQKNQRDGGAAATGQTGQASGAQGAPPSVDRPQQNSGITAPVPQGGTNSAPTVTFEQAQAYEGANDLRECQAAAQKLRRAGVDLPPGLLALAALKPEFLSK